MSMSEHTVKKDVPDYKAIWTEMTDPETGHYVSGWGVIIEGADVSPAALALAVEDYHGPSDDRLISEVQHLSYMPRVKWCSNHGGWGCDMEGDWHGHWFGVKHNDAAKTCCYTLALPVRSTRVTSSEEGRMTVCRA